MIDLGPGHIRVAVTDMGSNIHADWQVDHGMTEVPDDTFAIVEDGLNAISGDYNGPPIAGCANAVILGATSVAIETFMDLGTAIDELHALPDVQSSGSDAPQMTH